MSASSHLSVTLPVVATLVLLFGVAPVTALEVGGGGGGTHDCLTTFEADVNQPASRPRNIECVDGDPTCDADGTVDGVCDFLVAVCANSTFDPRCSLSGVGSITVDHALDNGDRRFDPDFLGLQNRIDNDIDLTLPQGNDLCSTPATIQVPIKGPYGTGNHCHPNRKFIKLTSVSMLIDGRVYTDRDRLRMLCLPAPGSGCDPQTLFASTFDRIQRQVFDQNCAVSGCHDSQSMTGGLLLENSSSYTSLVDQPPSNGAAAAAGWKRVDAAHADPAASFIVHKLEGDLPDASYGARMPFGKRKLNSTLRDLIRHWIEAGAPQTGWVPGTD